MKYLYIALTISILYFSGAGCRKDIYIEDPAFPLIFTTDTVHFDTVFATIGSATKNFMVKNPNKQGIKFKSIRLAGGDNSEFRINIDGRATSNFQDYELDGEDSIFIFVEVTVNPGPQNPLVVEDSVMFEYGSKKQRVILDAFGQDVHKIEDSLFECNVTLTNDKPYLIYRNAGVSPGCKLTIEKGCKIFSHNNSGIFVWGTLEVNGTKDEPVIFRGDRLEKSYENEPGQWYGIRFLPKSQDNKITHAVISNAVVGIEVDSLPQSSSDNNLVIEKTIIKNALVAGLVGYSSHIQGKNLLIHTCGQATFAGDLGGRYHFTNCTFDNTHSFVSRSQPSLWVTNSDYVDRDNNITYTFDLEGIFLNCIIWGNIDDEVKLLKNGGGTFSIVMDNNLIKAKDFQPGGTNIVNKYPKYKNSSMGNYQLDTLSPAIDAGQYFLPPFDVLDDIENKLRDSKPDIGAYEYIK